MTPAAISIAMTTFNGARFLPAQLDSLAAQTLAPIELQIGDDGSTDQTAEIVAAFVRRAPFPVHFTRNPRPLGFGENFLQTARRCAGNWIAFCDQDDVWLPKKLERCALEVARGGPDLRLVAHDAALVTSTLEPIGPLYGYAERETYESMTLSPEWFCVGFSQVLSRRLVAALPTRPRPTLPGHPHSESHDVWSSLVANATGTIVRLGTPLVLYRRHGANATDLGREVGIRERWRTRLRVHPEDYAQRGQYLRGLADLLNVYGDETRDSELRDRLGVAANSVRELSAVWSLRSALHTARSPRRRLSALLKLTASGAYSGGGIWKLGPENLLKDTVGALLPSLLTR